MQKNQKRKAKLFFFSEYFPESEKIDVHGGVEIRTYYLSKALMAKYDVTVIASKEKNKPLRQKIKQVTVVRLGLKRAYKQRGDLLGRLSYIFSASLFALFKRVDLVEGSGFIGQIPAWLIGSIRGVPTVAFVPDTFSDVGKHFNNFEKELLKLVENKVLRSNSWRYYIVISREVYKKLGLLGIPLDKIKLIYCAVDVREVGSVRVGKTIFPSLSVAGRLVQYKRVTDIVRAVSLLKKTIPNLKCFIIGSGEEYKKISSLISKLKLGKNVKLLGFVADHRNVIRHLKQSWIYCSASIVEGFGITTIEAIASKTVCLLADMPVNREITAGKGCLYFKPKDHADLAGKIKLLIGDRKLRGKLIIEGQDLLKKYTLKSMVRKTEFLYRKILNLD